jgi:NAD(P)H-nitrite reductase large subunit
MRLIADYLPTEEGVEDNGSIQFTHGDYMYNIGTQEEVLWISRQTIEDYENGKDNYERIDRWVPENELPFKLLRGNKDH